MDELEFGIRINGVKYIERPGVYGLIFDKQMRIAVIKTSTGYFLLDGGLDGDETHDQCLQRECLEETGYRVRLCEFIGKASAYIYSTKLNCYLKGTGYFYIAELIEKTEYKIEDDHELIWMYPEKAAKMMFLENQAWAIRKAAEFIGLK